MAGTVELRTPLSDKDVAALRAGDDVRLAGDIYTARDAAHKRLVECIRSGGRLPFDLNGQVIYYVGPTPARPGRPIGAAGPTTAARMDPYTEPLLARGLKATIGKGPRSPEIVKAFREHNAVYLVAPGGIAALMASFVEDCQPLAYPELGPEAIYKLIVKDFPAVVAYDPFGGDLFAREIGKYRSEGPVPDRQSW